MKTHFMGRGNVNAEYFLLNKFWLVILLAYYKSLNNTLKHCLNYFHFIFA